MKNREARSSITKALNRTAANSAGLNSWFSSRLDSVLLKLRYNGNTTTFAEKLNNKAIRQQIANRLEDIEEYGLLSRHEIAQRKAMLHRNCIN